MNNPNRFSPEHLPSLRILVVDDNRTNLQILRVFLKKLGHETITAENGEQAVAICIDEQPDMILLDIMMPVMDGFEAARRIRAQSSDHWIPIVFLSALDRDENLATGLEAGGDDFLSKPINFVALEAKVRAMQRMLMLQRRSTEALKRVQAITDNVLDAIITINTTGTIIACNASTERMFGWKSAEMIGQNVKMLMPEPFQSAHDGYLRNYVQGGPPQTIGYGREAVALHKDGHHIPMELGITEVRYEQERLFVGVIRDITERKSAEEKLRENAAQLQRYFDETEAEAQLARSLIDRQLLRPGLDDSQLHYWLTPAQNFSGDVVAAGRSPDGRLYALLADATGHGLAAAISTLPVLTIFYGMIPAGRPLAALVGEINRQLRHSVPVGRFVAATFVCLDTQTNTAEIWVGGTPEVLLLDGNGTVTRRFASQQIPLGIVDTTDELMETECFSWTEDCQLLICSDGLLEACNREETPFGNAGLERAVADVPPQLRHDAVRAALLSHLDGLPAHDDVSLLLLDCNTTRER